MRFKQHVPAFISIDPPAPVTFDTLEELLSIDFLKRLSERSGFSNFARSDDHLMALFEDGRYYVAGHLEDAGPLDLPEWEED